MGLESLLISELEKLGVEQIEKNPGAIVLQADLGTAYRICLSSRVASRVLWRVAEKKADNVDALYAATCGVSWPDYFSSDKPVRILLDAQQVGEM